MLSCSWPCSILSRIASLDAAGYLTEKGCILKPFWPFHAFLWPLSASVFL